MSGIAKASITRYRSKDTIIYDAYELAKEAILEVAHEEQIGEHLGVVYDAPRLATHCFTCLSSGYKGWVWVATLARVPHSRTVTVCEVAIVPSDGALLAPTWVPWSDRLRPSDLGPGDVLPKDNYDYRLEQGFEATGEEADQIADFQIGLGRARVLSAQGRQEAYKRWYNGERGPNSSLAKNAGASCGSCGFYLQIAGSARAMFGVCANEWSPNDGKVVTIDHGCGAHSETDEPPTTKLWEEPEMVVDETDIEVIEGISESDR